MTFDVVEDKITRAVSEFVFTICKVIVALLSWPGLRSILRSLISMCPLDALSISALEYQIARSKQWCFQILPYSLPSLWLDSFVRGSWIPNIYFIIVIIYFSFIYPLSHFKSPTYYSCIPLKITRSVIFSLSNVRVHIDSYLSLSYLKTLPHDIFPSLKIFEDLVRWEVNIGEIFEHFVLWRHVRLIINVGFMRDSGKMCIWQEGEIRERRSSMSVVL